MSEQLALPVLDSDQKLTTREIQLEIQGTSININAIKEKATGEIKAIQDKAQADIKAEQQKSQQLSIKLRGHIEGIAKAAGLDFTKVTFDLDKQVFSPVVAPTAPPAPPAPASRLTKKVAAPKA